MMNFSKWVSATLAIVLFAGAAPAADTVSAGKVKTVNADNKTFVVTDAANKDSTFKLDDKVVINRGGMESKSDLKAGDAVSICHDGGALATAHYILVQEGFSKSSALVRGNVKGYDAGKKELTFTDSNAKTWTFPMGKANVRLNMHDSNVGNIKSGDNALIIVDKIGTDATLKSVMVDRK
jgi:hypothetical protein